MSNLFGKMDDWHATQRAGYELQEEKRHKKLYYISILEKEVTFLESRFEEDTDFRIAASVLERRIEELQNTEW